MEQQKYHERGGLLGKLSPGEKKLDGKTFYLDRVKKRSTALLLEAITQFGGKIESFLHKDVKFVVTGSLEELSGHGASDSKAKSKTTSEEATPSKQQESVLRNDSQRQGTPRPVVNACGSRGKALLEKAIRNNERLQGSSVLTNARSWGVKILYADDVLLYLKQLSRESFDSKSKKSEKVYIKQSSNVVKATALRSPYLKIEDSSRKYKPLHMQSMTFPSLYYSGQYSPFECPPPPRFEKWTETTEKKNRENHKVVVSTEDKCQTPLSCNPSPWRPRKKDVAYCECCHQTYNNQEEHLQSDQHRAFVLDASNYSVVDQLVAAMVPDFNPDPPPQPKEPHDRQTSTIQDVCELEPLTDMEMEDAVKELQTQLHLDTDVSSLTKGTVLPALAINKLEIQQPTPNPVEVEIPALTPETDSKPLSPVMPMLEIVPQEQPLTDPHQDIKPLSPCPVNRFTNPDPFPPVLSPQVADLHAHSSDLEAPILSPQPLTSEEPKGEHVVEIDNQSSVFQPIPVDTLLSTTPVYTAVELCEKTESEIKVAICYNSWKRRSRSLPKQSTTTLNSKKRCRSASPECSLSKRRRTNAICGYKKTKQGPQSGITKDKYSLFFESASSKFVQSSPKPVRTLTKYCTIENSPQIFSTFSAPQMNMAAQWPPSSKPSCKNSPPGDKSQSVFSSQDSQPSNSHSTSVCIESALIPDIAALSSLSSDSDWDCELLSRLGPPSGTALAPVEPNCELDQEFLHQPCTWMHDSSYESRLHNVLQPTTQAVSVDSSSFSRAVVQIVEVQH